MSSSVSISPEKGSPTPRNSSNASLMRSGREGEVMAVATKPTMEGLLRLLVEQGATDLHLSANLAPHLRVDDRLLPTDHAPLSGDDVKELAYSLIPPEKVERFERWKELDFAFSIEGLARFRANYFIQQGYVGVAIRMLPFRI